MKLEEAAGGGGCYQAYQNNGNAFVESVVQHVLRSLKECSTAAPVDIVSLPNSTKALGENICANGICRAFPWCFGMQIAGNIKMLGIGVHCSVFTQETGGCTEVIKFRSES